MPQVNESIKRERNSYSIRQKEQVIAYANIHGQNKAANYFDKENTELEVIVISDTETM